MDIDDFKRKGPSIWSFLIMGIVGAVIGAFLTLSFAPVFMYEGMSFRDDSVSAAYTPGKKDNTDEGLSYAARSIKPSLVAVAVTKDEKTGRKILSSCTGFVVDSTGYILTGYQPALNSMYVYLQNNTSFKAAEVWSDKDMGISIIKIDKTGLTSAVLGDSEKQEIGDITVAAEVIQGNSLQIRLSSGIINSMNRSLNSDQAENLQNLLQSDAARGCVSPEGTPLVNTSGEVIGINIAKNSQSDEKGFSIPINLVKPIIYSLSLNGSFKEPDMGIEGIDSELAEQYHIEVESGIYINKVTPGGGAQLAGLKEGDTILAVSSTPVNTVTALKEQLYKVGVGNIANLKIKYKDGTVDYLGVILNEKDKK